jgi:pentatricopeptide repeat protein
MTQYNVIRCFESAAESSQNSLTGTLQRDTEYFLSKIQNPVGSFSEKTMDRVIDLMEAWIRKNSFEGAQRATDLLYRIIDENLEGNPQAYFNNTMVETILLYWREVSENVCALKASEIILRIKSIREEKDLPYNETIAVLCKCRNRSAAIVVEGLLYKMIMLQKENNNESTKVDIVTFNSAISAWLHISQNEDDAGQRALGILNRMKGMWRIGDSPVKPNINSFSMTIKALIRSEGPSAALQAEELLQDFLFFQDGRFENKPIDSIKNLFDTVLGALDEYSAQNEEASHKALSLLRDMERMQKIVPDSKSYLYVLKALSKRGISSISIMEQIVNEIEQKSDRIVSASSLLSTEIYNTLVKVYAENGKEKEAEAILNHMKSSYLRGDKEKQPNSVTWNSVIKAYIKSDDKNATYNATRILQEMAVFAQDNPETQPDTVTISIMLQALSRKSKNGDRRAKDQAVLILNRMLSSFERGMKNMKPDKIIFSKVIDCVAKAGAPDSGKEAMELLERMELFSKSCGEDLIDSVIYNTVIQAISNSYSKNAAIEADNLFQKMKAKGESNCAPSVATYTSLINAWGKAGSKERVLELLHEVETHPNVIPNTVLYATALNALAKSKIDASTEDISTILQQMENGWLKVTPNAYCYAALVESISNNPDKQAIRTTLTKAIRGMVDFVSKNRNNESYTVVLNNALKAIEKSNEKAKHKLAQQIMDIVLDASRSNLINVELSVRTYNAFIRCCAFTDGDQQMKNEAFDAALSALKEMREAHYLTPDLYTYPAMIRAAEELLVQNKKCLENVKDIFMMCCEDGLVDGLILNNISNYLSGDALRDVLQINKVSLPIRLNDLPREWSRNIYRQNNRKRRTNKWYRGSGRQHSDIQT